MVEYARRSTIAEDHRSTPKHGLIKTHASARGRRLNFRSRCGDAGVDGRE